MGRPITKVSTILFHWRIHLTVVYTIITDLHMLVIKYLINKVN